MAAPADPAGALHTVVARLRRLLPPDLTIATVPGGYRLDAAPGAVDLTVFADDLAAAAGALVAAEPLRESGRWTASPRHRSLRDVVAWSHRLLDDRERVLFERLSVFAGPVERAAVVRCAAAPTPCPTSSTAPSWCATRDRRRAVPSRRRRASACWRRCGRSAAAGWPPTRHRDVALLLGALHASGRAGRSFGADAQRGQDVAAAARTALGPAFAPLHAQKASSGDSGAVALARRLVGPERGPDIGP